MITRYLPFLLLVLPFVAAGREPDMAKAANKPNAKPLAFIENKGQIVDQYGKQRKDIDVKLEANGLTVFVGDGAIYYQWTRQSGASTTSPRPDAGVANWQAFAPGVIRSAHETADAKFKGGTEDREPETQPVNIETYRMDVELVGADKEATVVYGSKQNYFENYYLPQCPDGATAYSYNTITYKNVYPGVDWVLYSKNNQLKYDFVVHPGGDAKQIKLRYKGATALYLKEGALIAETPFGSITEQKPYSYDAKTKAEVASSFVVEGNELRFAIAPIANTLVIDPNLKWATYYGGNSAEYGLQSAFDTLGNVYLAGRTTSSSNIATTGAHQTVITTNAGADGMLIKFNNNGVRQWATYYGGSNMDEMYSVAYSVTGHLYAAGSTQSLTGIASAGAHQAGLYNSQTGSPDLYLVKFDLAGARQWATYYGGEGNEYGGVVTCDGVGNIYLAGATQSDTNISTPGSAQPTRTGAGINPYNGVLAKFSSTGTRLWGTYFGTNHAHFYAVACDAWNNVYAAGLTGDTNTATLSCVQPYPGGNGDGMLVKYNSNGTRLWWTYYGGSGTEAIPAVHCYGASVFIGGRTGSSNNMATPGAFQTIKNNWDDGFIAKLDSSGNRDWGTYIGGNGNESINGIAAGPAGNIYIAGYQHNSTSNISTPGAFQTTYGGGYNDMYFAEFSFTGARQWASYYGGPGEEYCAWHYGCPIAYDLKGDRIYLTGFTGSTSGIATSNGHQTTLVGSDDAFLVKFEPDTSVYILQPYIDTVLCAGSTLKLPYKAIPAFGSNNVFTAQLSDASGSFANAVTIGTKNSGVSDTILCLIPANTPNGTGYRVRIIGTHPIDTSLDNGINIRINNLAGTTASGTSTPVCSGWSANLSVTTSAGSTYSWAGPLSFGSPLQAPVINNITTAQAGDYIVTVTLGACSIKDTVTISVKPTPATPTASANTPLCAGGTLNLSASTTPAGATYQWNGPNGFNTTTQNPVVSPATMADAGVYNVTAELNGCVSDTGTVTVVVNTVSSLNIYPSPNDTICAGSTISFVSVPLNAGSNPQYQWYRNGVSIPGATNATYSTSAVATGDSVHCVMTVTGVCSGPLSIASGKIGVTVTPLAPGPAVTITADPGLLLSPWQLVTFTATVTGADSTTKYQWKRNGQNVIGATSNYWSAYNLSNGDTICCVVSSDIVCATPDRDTSNKMVVNIKTGIKDIEQNSGLTLYPNPNNGSFVIDIPLTPFKGGMVSVDVVDVVGRIVYSNDQSQVINHKIEIALPASVASGVYLLKLQHEAGTEMMRFTVTK
jgi:hypothetical protein